MRAPDHGNSEAARRSSGPGPDVRESPQAPADFLALQREALRRFRAAETERRKTEKSAAAELNAAREQAAGALEILEREIADYVVEAEAVLPDARKALEHVGMASLLDRSDRVDLPEGSPFEVLPSAVEVAREAAVAVGTRVAAYQRFLEGRRSLRQIAFVGLAGLLIIAVAWILSRSQSRGDGYAPADAATSLAWTDTMGGLSTVSTGDEVTEQPVPGHADDEPTTTALADGAAQAEQDQQQSTTSINPDPSSYDFAVKAIDEARAEMDRGEYTDARRRLRRTHERLQPLAERYPNSEAIREYLGLAMYMIERAGAACEAERAAEQQRGEIPRECN
ncbi:MAG TPA: hypothetical protein VK399_13505 [Longimicrobiaceae bacterium]|nr:hypothetical protein [Longimicrobiaceae bacterium]